MSPISVIENEIEGIPSERQYDDDTGPTVASMGSVVQAQGDLAAGTRIDRYIVQRTLGTGGFSSVYAVTHIDDGHQAAIKVLTVEGARSWSIVQRFEQEVQAIQMLAHPNIAVIKGIGSLPDGRPYYVMELVDGVTLSTLIRARGRIPLTRAASLLSGVGAALIAAHSQGVVHRDIKPGNVLVGERDGEQVVKLIDFGVAKLVRPESDDAGLTALGQRIGTPVCMAPEQISGRPIDHRVDIYAMGVLLFYLLTGKYPFSRAMVSDLEHVILTAAPPLPSSMAPVRPEVDAIVLKCLEKNPSDRYQRVEDLLAALSDVAERFGSGTDSDTYERRAVGIYLETRFAGTDGAEADDAAVDDMDEILETAEDFLIASGFQVLFQTGEALLGVALIPEDPTAKDIERIHILDLTREMFRVATRAAPNTSVQVCVAIHIDRVSVRDIGHTQSIEGGDITCTTWVPQPPQAGVTPTPAFLRWSRGHDA